VVPRRGDIYWVDFGYPRGSEPKGRRPALIIQNDIGNYYGSTTIVAAITHRQKTSYPFHVHISARESGLPQDSTVQLENLLTISKERLTQYCGRLDSKRMEEVDKALRLSPELP